MIDRLRIPRPRTRGWWFLPILLLWGMNAAHAAPAPSELYPHPCFVPPVPQKRGIRPRLNPPTTVGMNPPVTFGGPAFRYYDWSFRYESTSGDMFSRVGAGGI